MKIKEQTLAMGIGLLFIVAIIGVSYAAFSYTRVGSKVNTITSGVLTMSYTESSNVINLTKALPTTDATGKARKNTGEYFDFSVSTNMQGTAMVDYEIAAEDVDGNTLSGNHIKYYLTKINADGSESALMNPKRYQEETTINNRTGRPVNMMSLSKGTVNQTEVTNYRLRIWVDEDYNPQGDGGNLVYKTIINVYGKVNEIASMPTGGTIAQFFGYVNQTDNIDKSKITKLTIEPTVNVPSTAVQTWDASEAKDGSVQLYTIEDSASPGNYQLFLQTNGRLRTPVDSSSLFMDFSAIKEIVGLQYLDTSQATNMAAMFSDCSSLQTLDLSYFDTSKVTVMWDMFMMCKSLTSVDISSFDTSNVTSMSCMFLNCSSLTKFQAPNFKGTNLKDISAMFENCDVLKEIDLSGLGMTKVKANLYEAFGKALQIEKINIEGFGSEAITDIEAMFGFLSNLKEVNLKDVYLPAVTSLSGMFYYCSSIEKIDLRSFTTGTITSMSEMFKGTTKLRCVQVNDKFTTEGVDVTNMFTGSGIQSVSYGSCA